MFYNVNGNVGFSAETMASKIAIGGQGEQEWDISFPQYKGDIFIHVGKETYVAKSLKEIQDLLFYLERTFDIRYSKFLEEEDEKAKAFWGREGDKKQSIPNPPSALNRAGWGGIM